MAITIDKLIAEYGFKSLKLLKLDIEGAEIEVLNDTVAKRICPEQVLVRYDELSVPFEKSRRRIESAHAALLSAGYVLIHRARSNFTYVLKSVAFPKRIEIVPGFESER